MERKWWTLIAICVATFMLLLDVTIVNVALPKIATSLHSSFSDIQWVIDAYALTLASLLLTSGGLADLLGRKRMFSIGLGLFSLTSLICGLSPSATFLIFARAGQGVGGAIMFATALALLAQTFEGRERGVAVGAWGATVGAAGAIGPLLGGGLTEGLGWRSIFYINVPIGLAALVLAWLKVEESRDPEGARIDWIGTVTFTAALFLLVFALIRGNALGWSSATIVSFLSASAVLLIVFVITEARSKKAMLDISLFRKPAFTGAAIVAFAMYAPTFGIFLYLTLYLQTSLGLSPLQTGLSLLPMTVMGFFVGAASGPLSERMPVRLLLGGGLALIGGALLLMRGLTASSGWTSLLAGFIVIGAGSGLIAPALASTAIGVAPRRRSGMASGINLTFRQVGTATGIAAFGAIFSSSISDNLKPMLAGTPLSGHAAQIAHAVVGGGAQTVLASVPAAAHAGAATAIHGAFATAMNDVFLVAAISAFTGAVLGLALVRARDFVSVAEDEPAELTAA